MTLWRYWQGNRLAIHNSQFAGLGTIAQWPWASYLCATVVKQYNLVPAKGVISLVRIVTAGLVESNGSLPPDL